MKVKNKAETITFWIISSFYCQKRRPKSYTYLKEIAFAINPILEMLYVYFYLYKVCNHPELFERREIRSPYYMKLDDYAVPKLLYREGKLIRYQSPKIVQLFKLSKAEEETSNRAWNVR